MLVFDVLTGRPSSSRIKLPSSPMYTDAVRISPAFKPLRLTGLLVFSSANHSTSTPSFSLMTPFKFKDSLLPTLSLTSTWTVSFSITILFKGEPKTVTASRLLFGPSSNTKLLVPSSACDPFSSTIRTSFLVDLDWSSNSSSFFNFSVEYLAAMSLTSFAAL